MWKRGWKRLVLWFFLGKWQKILSCCARVLESRNRLIENDWWTLNIGMPSSIPSCPPHELNSDMHPCGVWFRPSAAFEFSSSQLILCLGGRSKPIIVNSAQPFPGLSRVPEKRA